MGTRRHGTVLIPRRWRVYLAALLLSYGIAFVVEGGLWPILGFGLLLPVPALIVDQAVRELRDQWWRVLDLNQRPRDYEPREHS